MSDEADKAFCSGLLLGMAARLGAGEAILPNDPLDTELLVKAMRAGAQALYQRQPRPPAAPTPLDSLELGVRAENCLKAENIYTVEQLLALTRPQLLRIQNLGRGCLADNREERWPATA